jgi:hypothetical protein
MNSEKIAAYCNQLKDYRNAQNADILLHRNRTSSTNETAVMLSKTELQIITKTKESVSTTVLKLDTGIITVNNQVMPQDYSEEFLFKIEGILKLLSTKDTIVYEKPD